MHATILNVAAADVLFNVQLMKEIGNENANHFWEWNATEQDKIKPKAAEWEFFNCYLLKMC